jgi:site-specific recombinase XerD
MALRWSRVNDFPTIEGQVPCTSKLDLCATQSVYVSCYQALEVPMNTLITLTEAATQYLEYLAHHGKKPRTLYTYNRDLQQILTFFGPERLIGNMPLPLIGRFLKSDELLKLPNGQERKPPTVNKTIRVFRMFMQWLVQVDYLPEVNLPKSIPIGRKQAKTPQSL